jgi:predicted permease
MTDLWNDLRFAMRQLRKSPGFTFAAVLTLALGIGAVTAMFSVIDGVMLHPLPYNGTDRILQIRMRAAAGYPQPASWPEYLDLRRLTHSFSALVGIGNGGGVTLTQGNQAIYLHAVQGTDNLFDLYGVRPMLGRGFLPGEDRPGKNHVAVLSYSVWQQDFGGRKSAIGRSVDLNGEPYTIIGVMPAGFRVRFDTNDVIYTPLQLSADEIRSRGSFWMPVGGRLKPGVTVAQANADINHVLAELGRQFPENDKGKVASVVPIVDALHTNEQGKSDRSELWLLLAAVFAVLLIACTNVAGLLLARGLLRERELAVRTALGAGRRRIVTQLLTESVLLGLGGGLGGAVLGWLLLIAMRQFLAQAFTLGGNVRLNVPVLLAAFFLSLVASALASLVPAWRAAHIEPNQAMTARGAGSSTRSQHRIRSSFVVVQIGLSLVLLVCSGMLLLALRTMWQTDLGFNPKNLLTLEVDVPTGSYKATSFFQGLVQPLEARVARIPGVAAVGSNDMLPIWQMGSNSDLTLVGHAPDPIDRQRLTEMRFVTPGYFAAMQLPVEQGRDFTAQDNATSRPVAIVNDTWVHEFLTNHEDPLMQAFVDDPGTPSTAVVGVAHSGRQTLFNPPRAEADFPMSQMPASWLAFVPQFYLFVRTSVPPTTIIHQLRVALHDVAPNVAFRTPRTMEQVLSDALVTDRMLSWLFGLFAAIAAVLTATGIYGLLSQEVASRTRDIGIRMALGATRAKVARFVLGRIAVLLEIGLGAGLVAVWLVRSALLSIMNVKLHHDLWTVAAFTFLMALIGLIAAAIPAHRAASIDPMEALRAE